MLLEWKTQQTLEYENDQDDEDCQMVYLLAPHSSALQTQ